MDVSKFSKFSTYAYGNPTGMMMIRLLYDTGREARNEMKKKKEMKYDQLYHY